MIVIVFSALVIIAIFVELLLEFRKLKHQKEGNTYVFLDKNETVNNTVINNELNQSDSVNNEVVEGSDTGVEIETQEEHKPGRIDFSTPTDYNLFDLEDETYVVPGSQYIATMEVINEGDVTLVIT